MRDGHNRAVTRPADVQETAGARRAALLGAAFALVAAGLLLEVADSVREHETVVHLDRSLYRFSVDHRTAWLSRVAHAVTLLGNALVVLAVVSVVVVALLVTRRRAAAAFLVASSGGAAILVTLTKHLVGRPRPPLATRLVHATGPAFPSGHAAQSIASYVAIALLVAPVITPRGRRVAFLAAAGVFALAIGASRVYLAVHWTSDVASGWLLGAGWLSAVVGVARAPSPRVIFRSRRPPPARASSPPPDGTARDPSSRSGSARRARRGAA
jgi:undecaprenyl-diphosphatase